VPLVAMSAIFLVAMRVLRWCQSMMNFRLF